MKTVHASEYAVQMKHCCKSFGRVVANDNVDLRLKWGEIHALLGENGSGKTTLVNMLSGIYQPDDGEIWVDGNQAVIDSPKTAYQLGIGMIHQHFMLVDVLSATENIILGQKGGVLLNRRKVSAEICAMIDQYGFHIDPNRKISEMSVSEKQTVEIIKALYRGAEILILDEPTAVLTPQETDRLFDVLRRMKDEGKCVVLISHKINELFAVADKVTILRKGKFIEELDMKAVTPDQLTSDMVGYPAKLSLNCPHSGEVKPYLSVRNLTVRGISGAESVKNLSFDANAGEILGIAGIAGSGQKELCDALAGITVPENGVIAAGGKEIQGMNPLSVYRAGIHIAYVPEDRLGMGLIPSMGMAENVMLRSFERTGSFFLDKKTAVQDSARMVKELDIATPDLLTPVSRLSGGNVQKVLLEREIQDHPQLLIAAYPVRGLDIGASYKIYDMMTAEKLRGACVLFIGEDLDALLGICDRILVLCGGEAAGYVKPAETTKNEIGYMMMNGGIGKEEMAV